MASFANTGFEPARPGEDAHTRQGLGRYQPGAAKGRISAAVADQCGEVDAGNVSIQVSGCRGRWFPGGKQDMR